MGLQGQRLETWRTLWVVGTVSVVAGHVRCSVLWSELERPWKGNPGEMVMGRIDGVVKA